MAAPDQMSSYKSPLPKQRRPHMLFQQCCALPEPLPASPLVRPIQRGTAIFLSKLAAVRCAFKRAASIMSRSGLPALRARVPKMRLNTPSWLQRTNRLHSVLCGPYAAGASHLR